MFIRFVDRKIKLIYNPASRWGKTKKTIPKIKAYLDERGIDYGYVETDAPLDGIEKSKSAKEEGYNVVCALGGDGTAHEIGNGAILGGLTLGVIPIGSGNDFASGLGIKDDWESGVRNLVEGKIEKISVTKAGDRYSINIIDLGFGADVAKASENHLRWVSGSKKYTLLMLALLTRHKPYPVTLTIDGKELPYNLNILAAGFGQSFGSGMNILPDARYNQQEMHMAAVHSAGKFKILRVFPKIFDASHVHVTDHVDMLRGKKVTIEPDPNHKKIIRAEADGELFWEGGITLEVVPEGLSVITPQEWSFEDKSLKVNEK
jgi:diacylglycerol kinase (ATP)